MAISAIGFNLPFPPLSKPLRTRQEANKHNSSTSSLPLVSERFLNAPPFRSACALADTRLWGTVRHIGSNGQSRIGRAVGVREYTQRINFAQEGAKVDSHGVIDRVEHHAVVHVNIDGIAGARAGAVGVVE